MSHPQIQGQHAAQPSRLRRGALVLLLGLEGMVCAGGAKVVHPPATTDHYAGGGAFHGTLHGDLQ